VGVAGNEVVNPELERQKAKEKEQEASRSSMQDLIIEHHCRNPSITNRECFFPIRSGFVIPYSIDVLSFHIPQQRRKSQHTTEYFTYHFHILKF
jgi:hypothetical protein